MTADSLGIVIRHARRAQCLAQRDAAVAIGVSSQYLSDIEHGRRMPPAPVRFRIAMVCGLDSDYIDYLAGAIPRHITERIGSPPESSIVIAWRAFEEASND